jgi:hypothetical protein
MRAILATFFVGLSVAAFAIGWSRPWNGIGLHNNAERSGNARHWRRLGVALGSKKRGYESCQSGDRRPASAAWRICEYTPGDLLKYFGAAFRWLAESAEPRGNLNVT